MIGFSWIDIIILWLLAFVFCILPIVLAAWAFGWFDDDQNGRFGE